jgi:hypothetical protein
MKWTEALDRVKNLAVHEIEWAGYVASGETQEDMTDDDLDLIRSIGGCETIEDVVRVLIDHRDYEVEDVVDVAYFISGALVCPTPFKFFVTDGTLDICGDDATYNSPNALTWDEIVKMPHADLLELMGAEDDCEEHKAAHEYREEHKAAYEYRYDYQR